MPSNKNSLLPENTKSPLTGVTLVSLIVIGEVVALLVRAVVVTPSNFTPLSIASRAWISLRAQASFIS